VNLSLATNSTNTLKKLLIFEARYPHACSHGE
jgi:hypothetical protein